MVYYLLKLIKFSFKKQNIKKILETGKNILEIREFCQSGKVGTMEKERNKMLPLFSYFQTAAFSYVTGTITR